MALKISLRGTTNKPNSVVVPQLSNVDWGALEALSDEFDLAYLAATSTSQPDSLEAQIKDCERLIEAANEGIALGNRLLALIQSGRPHPNQGVEQSLAEQASEVELEVKALQSILELQQEALLTFKETARETAGPKKAIQAHVSDVLNSLPVDDGESN